MAPRPAKVINIADLNAKQRNALASGSELGTQFDSQDRMFTTWGDGSVLETGEWTAREMSHMLVRDGQAAAIESVLTLPIRQASRSIEAGKDDNGEAEFVRSVLMQPATGGGMKTPLQDVIGQMTSAQAYRRSFHEKVWAVRESDGRLVYDKLAYRPPATCELKRNARTAELEGFRQSIWMMGETSRAISSKTPGWVDIPAVRAFVYIHGKHRQPLSGTSELDLTMWCYQTKMKLLFLWYQYLEAQSLPKVIVYGQSQDEANSRADDVASMRASGIVGFKREGDPGEKSYDIIESSGKGASQFADALSFLETWQTSSVLAGFMGLSSLASLGRGSLALSQDQSAFFLKSRQAVTAEMEEAITHDVIAPLVTLNFGASASFPRFRFGALTDESGAQLVSLFQALAVAPSLQVPAGILDLIAERTATYLNLDVNAVDAIIQQGAKDREAAAAAAPPAPGVPPKVAQGVARMAGGVNAAHSAVQKAIRQSTKAALPEDMNQPYSVPNMGSGTQAG